MNPDCRLRPRRPTDKSAISIRNLYVTFSVFRNATLLTVSSQFCSTK